MNLTNGMMYNDEFILYKKIIEYLENEDEDEDKLFIVNEMDKHESSFAWMSSNNDIGVLAKSELVGCMLLFLLEIVIDKHPGLLEAYIDNEDYKNITLSMQEEEVKLLIKKIQNTQSILLNIVSIYSLGEKIPIKGFRNEIMYYKELKYIDSWDIKQIKKAINDLTLEIIQ